jgi:hypothetical protein
LQCPHQGAKNFTKAFLPAKASSKLPLFSSNADPAAVAAIAPARTKLNFMILREKMRRDVYTEMDYCIGKKKGNDITKGGQARGEP